jgi:hypothetical protein
MTRIECPSCGLTLHVGQIEAGGCGHCGRPLPVAALDEAFGPQLLRLARLYRELWIALGVLALVVVAALVAISQGAQPTRLMLSAIILTSAAVSVWLVVLLGRAWQTLADDDFSWGLFIGIMLLAGVLGAAFVIVALVQVRRRLGRLGLRAGLFGPSPLQVEGFLRRDRCRACGYDLTGNDSGRCPECGTATMPTGAAS